MTDVEDGEYELVMPFVVCQSNGGPYDDESFAAGMRLGRLDSLLKLAQAFPELEPVGLAAPPVEEAQIDLLAMFYGFVLGVEPYNEDWSIFRFERKTEEDLT